MQKGVSDRDRFSHRRTALQSGFLHRTRPVFDSHFAQEELGGGHQGGQGPGIRGSEDNGRRRGSRSGEAGEGG